MRPLQRLIDHLVLLHPALALEGGGDDMGGVMVAVAAQILDRDCARRAGPALISRSIVAASIAMRVSAFAQPPPPCRRAAKPR